MLPNHNNTVAFNDFREMPNIPYKIIQVMLKENSQEIEDFWKLLKYSDIDCLSKPNLTRQEKKDLIWQGQTEEQYYNVFIKPMVGSSLDTAEAQTQIRLFRHDTAPNTQYEAIICFEIDFITNEKTTLVKKDGMLVEKTDLMEALFLSFINGRDLEVGSDFFRFDKSLTRSCNSLLGIGNSKSFYGRSVIIGLRYSNTEIGGGCI